jgi:hypothetical protein
MDGIEVLGVDAVVADLESVPVRLAVNLVAAVRVNASKIRDDARQRISGHRYLPAYPYSITYDTTIRADSITAEIGPDKAKAQGPLGNLIEYGSAHNAPLPHLGPALDAATDDLFRGIDIAVQQATT